MDSENSPVAFVAMKFDSDHWRDRRYVVIKEELEQAGFACTRADEISTSGLVVDEVCRLLRDATLVVIDSSGDSQSVSYEIGYCHGVGRPASTTLLLRSDGNIPFNYRHFRHRVYKDLRHLRRLIRDYLKLSEPIVDEMYGYAFTFEFSKQAFSGYIYDGAACIFDALATLKFTGRVECYAGEQLGTGERLFTVGIAVRLPGRKPTPTYEWWQKVVRLVLASAARSKERIKLDSQLSELASKRGMKAWFPQCGSAEFVNGLVVRLIGGAASDQDSSFFSEWMQSANRNSAATPIRQVPQ